MPSTRFGASNHRPPVIPVVALWRFAGSFTWFSMYLTKICLPNSAAILLGHQLWCCNYGDPFPVHPCCNKTLRFIIFIHGCGQKRKCRVKNNQHRGQMLPVMLTFLHRRGRSAGKGREPTALWWNLLISSRIEGCDYRLSGDKWADSCPKRLSFLIPAVD